MDPYKLYVYNYISGARIHDFIRFYKELFTPKMLRATASLPICVSNAIWMEVCTLGSGFGSPWHVSTCANWAEVAGYTRARQVILWLWPCLGMPNFCLPVPHHAWVTEKGHDRVWTDFWKTLTLARTCLNRVPLFLHGKGDRYSWWWVVEKKEKEGASREMKTF